MRIEILDLAKADILEGFHFYEAKEEGLGTTTSPIYFQTLRD